MRQRHATINRGVRTAGLLLMLVLLLGTPGLAAEPNYPQLTGRVVDEAGILSPATINDLTNLLAKQEQATGQQVVVVTLKSLQGYPIEDFGYQLGRHWGIGQKDKNTGALLIVAPKERKVRIEVGYGLEGKLTDALSRIIIEGEILPNFRHGNFDAGVLAGTISILNVLSGGSAAATQPNPASRARLSAHGSQLNLAILLAIFLVFIVIQSLLARRYGMFRHVGRRTGYGGFPGGGFSGGGGGFSGGGGSFGGGGASGSW